MKHYTSPHFWKHYNKLPVTIRQIADKNFQLLKSNPYHHSLNLKKIGKFWSIRITLKYRALGLSCDNGIIWFWIGNHDEYEKLIGS